MDFSFLFIVIQIKEIIELSMKMKEAMHSNNRVLLQGIILKENKNIGEAERMFIQVSL